MGTFPGGWWEGGRGRTSKKPKSSNIDLNQLRILSRWLETAGDRSVPEDNVGSSQLAILVQEDPRLQNSIKIFSVH